MRELCDQDVRRMVRLLADVAIQEGDLVARKRALMDGLAELTDADGWLWTLSRVDIDRGVPMSLGLLHGGLTDEQVAGWIAMSHDLAHPPPEHQPLTLELSKGRHFTRTRRQIVDDRDWYQHPVVQQYRLERGIDHFLYSIYPLDGPEAISGVGLYRRCGRQDFTGRQRRIAHIVLGEVEWLHYAGLPTDRGGAVTTLSPRQRMVFVLLLEGRTRNEIARMLCVSPHTAHDHTKVVYRHFKVSSQLELIRRFKVGDECDMVLS